MVVMVKILLRVLQIYASTHIQVFLTLVLSAFLWRVLIYL